MLRVRVCATHMSGCFGPNFSKQESLFWQSFFQHGLVFQKLAKIVKMGSFSTKLHQKSGYDGNCR